GRQPAVRLADSGEPDAKDSEHVASEILMRLTLTRARRTTQAAEGRRDDRAAPWLAAVVSSFSSVVLLTLSAAAVSTAQQPAAPPTFGGGTRLIVQIVSVKDKDGRALEGLSAKDFVLTEDGEPQTIAFAEFERLPDRRTEPLATEATPRATVVPPSSPATQSQ